MLENRSSRVCAAVSSTSVLGMVGVFGIELQQAVRQQEDDDALPGRAQRYGIDHARETGAELGGDFRDRMQHPVAVPELLEAVRDDRPELAAGTLIDAAVARPRRGDDADGVAIEFADGTRFEVPGQDFPLRGQRHRYAGGFGQAVGHSVNAPVHRPIRGFLAPARLRQRDQRCAEEENPALGRHRCHYRFVRARSIHRRARRRNQKRGCAVKRTLPRSGQPGVG